jgi:hypothetical protein
MVSRTTGYANVKKCLKSIETMSHLLKSLYGRLFEVFPYINFWMRAQRDIGHALSAGATALMRQKCEVS